MTCLYGSPTLISARHLSHVWFGSGTDLSATVTAMNTGRPDFVIFWVPSRRITGVRFGSPVTSSITGTVL